MEPIAIRECSDVEACARAEEWGRLAQLAHRWLRNGRLFGLNEDELEDYRQDFLTKRLLVDTRAAKFWRPALARTTTLEGLRRYLLRSFRHFVAKALDCRPSDGIRLRRRVQELLKENSAVRFRPETSAANPVYGRISWPEQLAHRGIYRGTWSEFEDQFRAYVTFPTKPVLGDRGRSFRDCHVGV